MSAAIGEGTRIRGGGWSARSLRDAELGLFAIANGETTRTHASQRQWLTRPMPSRTNGSRRLERSAARTGHRRFRTSCTAFACRRWRDSRRPARVVLPRDSHTVAFPSASRTRLASCPRTTDGLTPCSSSCPTSGPYQSCRRKASRLRGKLDNEQHNRVDMVVPAVPVPKVRRAERRLQLATQRPDASIVNTSTT